MAKSELIKDLVCEKVSIAQAIERIKVICFELENVELTHWLEKEYLGYSINDTIPEYRILESRNIKYSGKNGSYDVKNIDFPLGILPPESVESLIRLEERDSISAIIEKAKGDNQCGRSLTSLAGIVYEKCGISCFEITQFFSYTDFQTILSAVKTRLLDILLTLEKEFGILDSLDIEVDKERKNIDKVNTIINNIILDNSIRIGDNNRMRDNDIGDK